MESLWNSGIKFTRDFGFVAKISSVDLRQTSYTRLKFCNSMFVPQRDAVVCDFNAGRGPTRLMLPVKHTKLWQLIKTSCPQQLPNFCYVTYWTRSIGQRL